MEPGDVVHAVRKPVVFPGRSDCRTFRLDLPPPPAFSAARLRGLIDIDVPSEL